MNLNVKTLVRVYNWGLVPHVCLSAFLSLGLVSYGYNDFVVPKKTELNKAKEKELSLKKEYERNYKESINLSLWEDRLVDIKVQASNLALQLPKSLNVDTVLLDISKTGVDSGIEFELFKPHNEVNVSQYVELPIDIKLTGDFKQVANFVNGIGQLPGLMSFSNINIKKVASDRLSFEAKIKAYKYGDLRGFE